MHRYREPVLASASDGVGTKSAIAQAMDIHNTIGIDLVAMVVDDLVACGAEPLFLQDYIACGKLVPDKIATLVCGIADGCVRAGCALVGGETAEHPGLMDPDDYDLAATAVGDRGGRGHPRARSGSGPATWCSAWGRPGCTPTGSRWCGTCCWTSAGCRWRATSRSSAARLGEELLEPCRIYALDCLALSRETDVHAYAHITGGGLVGNLARVIPAGLTAVMDRRTWTPLPVFGYIANHGRVSREEMEKAFNMGIGMVAVLSPEDVDRAMAVLMARHVPTVTLGVVERSTGGSPRAVLTGDHPWF